MIELEVYARGLRDLNKILELDLQLEPIAGLHYKIDTNHDLVYFECHARSVSVDRTRNIKDRGLYRSCNEALQLAQVEDPAPGFCLGHANPAHTLPVRS